MSELNNKKNDLVRKLGGKLLWSLERFVKVASKVPTTPFLDPYIFDWTKKLEDNWKQMRKEVDKILQHQEVLPNFQDISEDQKAITTDDNWKTFFLFGFGEKMEKNCEICPETTRLIEDIPGMKTAFFSILSPGKHIPEHRGLYKGFLRYHLGLKVPEPNEDIKIRVDDQYAHWEEGKSLLFDDTYQHEVWNNTDGIRVVLFMDILRPISFPISTLNNVILRLVKKSDYVQSALKNQEAWEKKLEEIQKSES